MTKSLTTTEIATWNIDAADGTSLIEGMIGTKAEAIEIAEMHSRMRREAVVTYQVQK